MFLAWLTYKKRKKEEEKLAQAERELRQMNLEIFKLILMEKAEAERRDQQKKQERYAKEEQERREAQEREAKKDQKTLSRLELEQMIDDKFKQRDAEKEQKREAKKEQERQAELNRARDEVRVLREGLEREKRERIEGQINIDRKMESTCRTIMHGFRLLLYCQRMHHSRYNYQTLEDQEHVKALAYFDLPKDNNEDLQNIYNASLIGNPYNPLDETKSSEHLNYERDITYKDIYRLAMTPVKDLEYSQDITISELNDQVFDDFEDDIGSSAIIPVGIVEGTRAKEEGNAYFKEQKFEQAIECYSKSINELPTAAAYGNRAMAYIKLNKYFEAEQDCTDALNIDDRYFKAYARRATARTKLGCNLEGALEDVQVARELEPNNQEMKELFAELMCLKAATEAKEEGNNLFNDKKFEQAVKSYTVSITKSPTAVAYSNRAMANLKLNNLMDAENDCTNALKIDDQYFKAYARRAAARCKLGRNLEGALEDVKAALKLEPNNQEMRELLPKLVQALG